MTGETAAYAPTSAANVVDFLDTAAAPSLFEAWVAALRSHWGDSAEENLRVVAHDRERGGDVFSLALDTLGGDSGALDRSAAQIAKNVRRLEYSISDLYVELSCLEKTLETQFRADPARDGMADEIMRRVRDQFRKLFAAVLDDTALVYETVVEEGGRAHCWVDDDGRIITANREMQRLLGIEDVEGRRLAAHFPNQEHHVTAALRGDLGPIGIRRFVLVSADGTRLTVNASFKPLVIKGERRGGYAILTDITAITKADARLFDELPLGIIRFDDQYKVTYANRKLGQIYGADPQALEGRSVWDLVAGQESDSTVREQIERRASGLSSEYKLDVRRLSDGQPIPVAVAATPEFDNMNNVVGSLGVVRSREIETACERFHRCMELCHDAEKLLGEVAEIIRSVVPFDLLTLSIFSRDEEQDSEHASPIFSVSEEQSTWEKRWFPISRPLAAWLKAHPRPHPEPDFEAFLERPEMDGLRHDPDVLRTRERGMRSFIVYSITREGQIIATLSLLSSRLAAYSDEECALLEALPIDRAIQMALYYREKAETDFHHRLLQKITSSGTAFDIATAMVCGLAEHYRWGNVSIFVVDRANRRLRLKTQQAGPVDGYLLPWGFEQPFTEGLLGKTYETRVELNVGDVLADPAYKKSNEKSKSEMCLPIYIQDQIRWILNIEDSRLNAFSDEERKVLTDMIRESERSLQHLFTKLMLEEIISTSSDLIVFTDLDGRITHINAAGKRMLGKSGQQVRGRSLRDFFKDPDFADCVLTAQSKTFDPTELRGAGEETVHVLLTGRLLSEEAGRRVFSAQDLSVYKRLRELEAIKSMFYEVAAQTRTPLALLSGWLRRLYSGASERNADLLEKAQRQLRKVELTFDRLLLFDDSKGFIPYNEIRLNMQDVLNDALEELPAGERERIEIDLRDGAPPPDMRGDPYQLSFIFQAILAYLLRFVADDERVTIGFSVREDTVAGDKLLDLTIAGSAPGPDAGNKPAWGEIISAARAEVALGESVIRRFVQQHGGTYERQVTDSGKALFRITLPAQRRR